MFTVTISGFKTKKEVQQWVDKNILHIEVDDAPSFFPDYHNIHKEEGSFKTNLNKYNFDIDIKMDYSKENEDNNIS